MHARAVVSFALVASVGACRSTAADHAATDCLEAPGADALVATYRSVSPGSPKPQRWRYWRRGSKIAFEYPDRRIVEVWNRYASGELAFERWFEAANRAIVYTSGELRSVGRVGSWDAHTSILAPNVRERLDLAGTAQHRCLRVERLVGTIDDRQHELGWLAELELPARLRIRGPEGESRLELQALAGAEAAAEAFARGDALTRTDFADVGDQEADPVIRELITRGLVEHPVHHEDAH